MRKYSACRAETRIKEKRMAVVAATDIRLSERYASKSTLIIFIVAYLRSLCQDIFDGNQRLTTLLTEELQCTQMKQDKNKLSCAMSIFARGNGTFR